MKQEKRKQYTFNFTLFQVMLVFLVGLILGILITTIPTIPTTERIMPPKWRQQPGKVAVDDTGPVNLLAVSSFSKTAQAKVLDTSSVSLEKPVSTETVSKVNSEIRTSFSDTVNLKSATTVFPVLTFTSEAMPLTTSTVTASPSTTVTPTASPTVTPSPATTVTPTASPTVTSSPATTVTPTASPTVTPSPATTVTPTASPTVTPKTTAKARSLTITTYRSINMYAKPDTDSAKTQTVPKGATLTNVTEIGEGWLRATYNGKTGYIYYLYTSFLQEKKIFSPVNKVIYRQHTTGVVTADRVNLRSCPGITAKSVVIATLPANTRIEIISHVEMIDDEEFGWLEIIVVGSETRGFLYEKYVSVNVTFRIDSSKNNSAKTPYSHTNEHNTNKTPSSNNSENNTGKKSSSSNSRSNTGKKSSSNNSKRDTGKKAIKTSKKSFKGVQLQYSAKYHITTNPLTRRGGTKRYNGHLETWYSEKTLPGGGLKIPGRHNNTADGTIRDKDGYICVASRDFPKHTILMTSLGPGKVYDWCPTSGIIDVYVAWDPPGKQKQVKKHYKIAA